MREMSNPSDPMQDMTTAQNFAANENPFLKQVPVPQRIEKDEIFFRADNTVTQTGVQFFNMDQVQVYVGMNFQSRCIN
jgi:hypothetical protein